LSAVCCLLSAACCLLPAACCLLPVLLAVCCLLAAVASPLLTQRPMDRGSLPHSSTFDNLKIDISWVVWEDVICDAAGNVKPQWVACIQKHHTKFFIGSDNVAQFFPITDTSTNLLASNITKYARLTLSTSLNTHLHPHPHPHPHRHRHRHPRPRPRCVRDPRP
jgi:hypothetical protein